MEKIAYIDLSHQQVSTKEIPDEIIHKYLGGRGVNAYLLYNHIKKNTDALSPENVLVFGTGLLTGYLGTCTARWHVSSKSPETGIYGDSNCGGLWGAELKQAGFQHLVIKGKTEKPTYLWIHNGQIEFRDASLLWGKDTYETEEIIVKELGDPDIQIACIGTAGEKLVRFANVRHGRKRAAGRTGMGCVMGSKQLKAIAVRGSQGLKPAQPKKLIQLTKEYQKKVTSTKIYPILSRYGNLYAFTVQLENCQVNTFNHQNTYFAEAEGKLDPEIFDEKYKTKSLACFSCPIHCSHRYRITSGPFAGTWGEGPEWYFLGGFGPQVGNSDWEVILVANDLCNQYGLDVGSVTAYTSWLMELYQRGIIDKDFTEGMSLDWGNGEAIIGLIHQMAKREGVGAKVANGWREAAKMIGKGCEYYIANTKGLTVECIDSRALRGTSLGESTSNRGYDHLRGRINIEFMGLSEEFLERYFGKPVASDPTAWEGKAWAAIWVQDLATLADALGICKFATHWLGDPKLLGFSEFRELTAAATGIELTLPQLRQIADRIWSLERMFSVRDNGVDREGDRVPKIYHERLKDGPRKGIRTDYDEYEKALDEYYQIRGWDASGKATPQTLKQLELDSEPTFLA